MPLAYGRQAYTRSGDKADAVGARQLLCVFSKPGLARKAKKHLNRRLRRSAYDLIQEQ
ncbi:hypothetical protein [Siphonobacter sp. BAB-5405]|uniref:hypothetical protein n=1 Tax=Siphonobacter sp. BAB-5405 TaxID=1864825 RepID=UPI001304A2A5|nr:hypothetical protein [Siphonobacter sp. BAB-5405]